MQPLTMTNSVPGPPWSRMPGEHGLGNECSLFNHSLGGK